jgi:putative ABC transport system ATP-binding protein
MNLIGCLDVPSKGAIFLDGKNISLMTESELAHIRGKKIGFIFQQFNLLNTLTALENVMLPLIFQEVPLDLRKKKAVDLLTKLGLGDRMDHRPNQLSGGQQQRVAIARALSVDPEVILADEPTGNLDSKMGKEILEVLKNLNRKEKKTVVIVTHDDSLAKITDRIAFLKDGKIIKESNKINK